MQFANYKKGRALDCWYFWILFDSDFLFWARLKLLF